MESLVPSHCTLCPRLCGADRTRTAGFCGGGSEVRIARAALHQWEEPCISGSRGSGAVFFSGCPLRCCFCQNREISRENFGAAITTRRLADIFLELEQQGAHNINLVSPTQYVPWILEALELARPRLSIPIVYNTGGYERVETLRMLEGAVDIYLPDLKYVDSARGKKYSGAEDYFAAASAAIEEMVRQTGPFRLGEDGLLQKGVVVRHLVLPGGRKDSAAVVEWLWQRFGCETVLLSLMSQYTPSFYQGPWKELTRPVSSYEYNQVVNRAAELGMPGYMQEKSSATADYTPSFRLEGVYPSH